MGLDDLLNNSKGTNKTIKKEIKVVTPKVVTPKATEVSKKPKKEYFRSYLDTNAIELIYDIVYTEKSKGNFAYTIGDAIYDSLKVLTESRKLKKAPESFKKK